MLCPWCLLQHGQAELVTLSSLPPLNFMWFPDSAVLPLSPLSPPLDSAQPWPVLLCVCPKMITASGTALSSYLTQWFKKGVTSALSHVVKGFQCRHHTSCPNPCCPGPQTLPPPCSLVPWMKGAAPLTWIWAWGIVCLPSIRLPNSHQVPWTWLPRHLSNSSPPCQPCCQEPLLACHHLSPQHTTWHKV